jgi:hypothetical protein
MKDVAVAHSSDFLESSSHNPTSRRTDSAWGLWRPVLVARQVLSLLQMVDVHLAAAQQMVGGREHSCGLLRDRDSCWMPGRV